MNILSKDKATQRNITPNFIVMKSTSRTKVGKNTYKNPYREKLQEEHPSRHERSNSRGSKCSFETYERRILHLSKLKNNLSSKAKNSDDHESVKVTPMSNNFEQRTIEDSRRPSSNSNNKEKKGRQNNTHVGITRKSSINDHSLTRKKSSGSGKIMFRPQSRSNSKRDEDSLQKEQQRAKIMNADLLADLNKYNQAPNFLHKLKLKKSQKQTKQRKKQKQQIKSHILKLNIDIKGPDALKEYENYGELGKGAYGTVRMGIHKKSGEKVAIKSYPKKHLNEMNRLKNLQRQINILAGLNNPMIAKLIEAIETPSDVYLILEYGGANSLYNYLLSKQEHKLKECEAKKLLHVIAQTLKYLHQKDIVHRDIKAENILINRFKELKVIDFGFSIHSIPPSTIDTFCGTPTYMAPQIVSKVDHVPIYTDLWSIGILYYVMLQGNYPFRSRNEEDLFDKIRRGKFEYIHNDISPQSKKLIESLLKVNPYDRLTVNELLSDDWKSFFSDARLEDNQ